MRENDDKLLYKYELAMKIISYTFRYTLQRGKTNGRRRPLAGQIVGVVNASPRVYRGSIHLTLHIKLSLVYFEHQFISA